MLRQQKLSMESIDYQNRTLFKELTAAVGYLVQLTPQEYEADKAKHFKVISDVLNHAFGFNCKFALADIEPCILFYDAYINNVLNTQAAREDHGTTAFIERYLQGSAKGHVGTVDIRRAKVSGIFSKFAFTVVMPEKFFRRMVPVLRLTPDQWAALILHEVGHFFTYCEYFSRTVTTNQALSALSKQLEGNGNIPLREIQIRKAADALGVHADAKALATAKNRIVEVALVTETIEKSRSELGVSIYDDTASEYLADQFVSRCGGAAALATALNEVERSFGSSVPFMSTPTFMLTQFLSLVLTLYPWTALVAAPVSLWYIAMGGSLTGNEYDSLEVRFRRIKHDAVNRLKNRKLGEEDKKHTLRDIEQIDTILSTVKERTDWQTAVASLFPTYRKYRNTTQLQKQLEQLGNSNLFTRAAELTTLSHT